MLGENSRALKEVDTAIRLDPNNAISYWVKGATLADMGQLRKALPFLERSYQLGCDWAMDTIQQIRQNLR